MAYNLTLNARIYHLKNNMKKALIITGSVVSVIIVLSSLTVIIFKKNGLDLLCGASSFISGVGMIIITYLVCDLTNENTKKDSYMKSIAKLYNAIEDDFNSLSSIKSNTSNVNCNSYIRRIKANSILICYYVERFPGYNECRDKLLQKGMLINYDPQNEENYNEFAKEFSYFCLSVRKRKTTNETFSFDDNGYVRRNL